MPQRTNTYKGTLSYDGLFQKMEARGITKQKLRTEYRISPTLITRLKKNENVSLDTILYLCDILDCDIAEIVSYKRGAINGENAATTDE